MLILDLWGVSFYAAVVFGLGKEFLFKSALGHCVLKVHTFLIILCKKIPPTVATYYWPSSSDFEAVNRRKKKKIRNALKYFIIIRKLRPTSVFYSLIHQSKKCTMEKRGKTLHELLC